MANASTPSGSSSPTRGQQVVDPAAHVGLAHAQVHLLVEQRQHGQRVGHPAVDADRPRWCRHGGRARWRSAARRADRCRRGTSASRRGGRGSARPSCGPASASGDPCASMPTASITASAPRPSVRRARHRRCVPCRRRDVEVEHVDAAVAARSGQAFGHEVDADHRPRSPRWRAIRQAMSPIGPRPSTTRLPPGRTSAYSHRLPRRRQHVGEVHEAVVGRALGHLDRPVVGVRHSQQLGLPARHLAVQLGVAEQRSRRCPCSRFWVVSHCDCRPWSHMKQWPQAMLNGTTTRSPTASWPTSDPTARTMPIGSWPRMSPGVMNGPITS